MASCGDVTSSAIDGGPGTPDAAVVDSLADAAPALATALFEIPRSGAPPSEFYALPFPNDLRRKQDGTIDVADHTRLANLVDTFIDVTGAKTPGFGTNSAIFCRFSDRADIGTLPQTPQESMAAASSVYLVDVSATAERGRRWPLRFRFETLAGHTIGANWLASLPYPGIPLRGNRTYALVVTRRLEARDLGPYGPSADFAAVLGTGAADADVTRARQIYQPLLDWLDEAGGDGRADVVSAAVFTTQDPTGLMAKMRQVIYAEAPAPALMGGLASEDRVGYTLYTGQYTNHANFQSGDPPYALAGSGEIVLDAGGLPIIQRYETLRFAVSIPDGTMPGNGWPVVLYAHGTGGSYRSFVNDGTAGNMALQGLAVISIDQVLHGPRDPSGSNPDLTFFNFLNPVAARDNVRQGGADDFSLLRFVKVLEIPPAHRFDGTKIFFMGHSQGGLTGPPFLAYEPEVTGAILSGAGGLLYYSLLNKTSPVDIRAIVQLLVMDEPLDEFNNILALVQMFIDGGDPVNYGPLLVREPPAIAAKNIYQSEGLIDHYTPPVNIESLAVAIGAQPVTPILQAVEGFALRGLPVVSPPQMDNVNGVTSVLLQYTPPAGRDGHFVVFDVPEAIAQSSQFLGTLAATGTATLVAP